MPTDSDHLAADGIPVTFADGIHYLRYPMRALKTLEDQFDGSLDNVLHFFVDPSAHFVDRLTRILAAGLAHEGYDVDKVLDQALTPKMGEYNDAALTAVIQALPPAPEGTSDEGKEAAASDSTGSTSTTPPPSSSIAATTSSGTT